MFLVLQTLPRLRLSTKPRRYLKSCPVSSTPLPDDFRHHYSQYIQPPTPPETRPQPSTGVASAPVKQDIAGNWAAAMELKNQRVAFEGRLGFVKVLYRV